MSTNIDNHAQADKIVDELIHFLDQEKTADWTLLTIRKDEWGGVTSHRSEYHLLLPTANLT
jgi:hypothetical protein